ncbi:MAG: hypothetical protein WD119_02450 [Pirellulaceae bacterium]
MIPYPDEQARLEAAEAHGEAHGQAIGRVQLLEQLAGVPESSLEALRQKMIDELASRERKLQRYLRERS